MTKARPRISSTKRRYSLAIDLNGAEAAFVLARLEDDGGISVAASGSMSGIAPSVDFEVAGLPLVFSISRLGERDTDAGGPES